MTPSIEWLAEGLRAQKCSHGRCRYQAAYIAKWIGRPHGNVPMLLTKHVCHAHATGFARRKGHAMPTLRAA